MNLLNNLVIKEDDNIDLLLSFMTIEEEPVKAKHHDLDYELKHVISLSDEKENNNIGLQYYMSQLYQTLFGLYYENVELRKRIDTLTVCNELLKTHIAENTKNIGDETMFSK
jgi:hypothetical protein